MSVQLDVNGGSEREKEQSAAPLVTRFRLLRVADQRLKSLRSWLMSELGSPLPGDAESAGVYLPNIEESKKVSRRIVDPDVDLDDPSLAIGHSLEYVKVAGESTARARTVLTLLISLSAASFAAFWNLDHTVGQRRIDLINEALAGGVLREEQPCANIRRADMALCKRRQAAWDEARRQYRALGRIGPADTSSLIKILNTQRDTLIGAFGHDARVMKLPVLDLTFEAPDLWLFTGFAFTLLLIALVYTIACERRDVRQAFQVAQELGTERLCLRMLAMRQVLSVPEVPAMPVAAVWRWLTRGLYYAPIGVQGYATYLVVAERHVIVGGVPEVTDGAWLLQIGLILATFLLTVLVSRLAYLYDQDWRGWTKRVRFLEQRGYK